MKIALIAVLAALISCPPSSVRAQNRPIQAVVLSREGLPEPGLNVSICQGLASTAASLSSNVVTLTMAADPIKAGFTQGSAIAVYGFSGADSFLNSTIRDGMLSIFTITRVGTNQISYALNGSDHTAVSNARVVGESRTACFPLATTYTDLAGNNTVVNQAYRTDEAGDVAFFAPPGVYLVQYSGASTATRLYEVKIGSEPSDDSGLVTGPSIVAGNRGTLGPSRRLTMERAGRGPYVDVRSYGVRALNPNTIPAAIGLTVNCRAGVSTVSLTGQSDSAGLMVGDGVVIYGCGPANSIGKPSAPTVTPSLASNPTGTGYTVASLVGSTNYSYKVVWRDAGQGLTAASAAGSTSAGQATLGAAQVSLSRMSMANNTVSATTSSAHNLAAGAMIWNGGMTDIPDFGGWYLVHTAPTNKTFTYIQGRDTLNGLANPDNSATGGIVEWFNCNHLALTPPKNATQGYIYKYNGTNYVLYGVTTPVDPVLSGDVTYMKWDDFGSIMMGGINLPAFVPTMAPSEATSDSLATTISAINGNILTLADPPSTTVSGATIRFDDAPNIAKVVHTVNNSIGGMIDFPIPSPGLLNCYVINSALAISGMVMQEGQVCLNDTLTLESGTQWHGDVFVSSGAVVSCPAFSIACHVPMNITTANPGILIPYTANITGVTFAPTGNAYTSVFVIAKGEIPAATFDNDNFAGTSTDYMGVGLYAFCPTSEAAGFSFHRDLFSSGIPQVDASTATPLAIFKNCGEISFQDIMVNRRGFYLTGNGASASFEFNYEEEGGITPLVTLGGNTASAVIKSVALDTMSHALVANLGGTNNSVEINASGGPSNGYGLVTGAPFSFIVYDGGVPIGQVGQNVGVEFIRGGFIYDGSLSPNAYIGTQNVEVIRRHVDLGLANSLFTDPGTPAAPACSVEAGGPPYSMSAYGPSTYTFAYSAVYPNGGYGPTSATVSCTLNGTSQQARLTAPVIVGATAYIWYFGTRGSLGNALTGGPYTRSIVVPSCSEGCAGFSNASAAGGGPAGIRGPLIWATRLETGSESTISQCFSSTSPAACGSNIDGFIAIPAGSSSVVVETTAVTAKSEISLTFDTTQSSNLGVTCNTVPQQPYISARRTGKSFTISVPSSFSKYPGCIGFHLKN